MRARLDTELVARGLTVSREQAKRLILAGAVRVNGQLAGKASDTVVSKLPPLKNSSAGAATNWKPR